MKVLLLIHHTGEVLLLMYTIQVKVLDLNSDVHHTGEGLTSDVPHTGEGLTSDVHHTGEGLTSDVHTILVKVLLLMYIQVKVLLLMCMYIF